MLFAVAALYEHLLVTLVPVGVLLYDLFVFERSVGGVVRYLDICVVYDHSGLYVVKRKI